MHQLKMDAGAPKLVVKPSNAAAAKVPAASTKAAAPVSNDSEPSGGDAAPAGADGEDDSDDDLL